MNQPTTVGRPGTRTGKDLAFLGARALVGIGALVLVVSQIQWTDALDVRGPGGEPQTLRGRLVEERLAEEGWILFLRAGEGDPDRILASDLASASRDGEGTRIEGAFRPGFLSIGSRARWPSLWVGVALLGVPVVLGALRWKILLVAQRVPLSAFQAFRLNWIGLFSSNLLPAGAFGGDLVKASLAVRGTRSGKTRAALSVFVDRALGLFSMVLVGIVALSLQLSNPLLRPLVPWGFGVLALFLLAGFLVLSKRFRPRIPKGIFPARWLPPRWTRPFARSLRVTRNRRGALLCALLVSLPSWCAIVAANVLIARGSGMAPLPVGIFFVLVPAAHLASAIPALPAGWGVGEAAYAVFFHGVAGVSLTAAIALSVFFRIATILWSLPGGVLFAVPGSGGGGSAGGPGRRALRSKTPEPPR